MKFFSTLTVLFGVTSGRMSFGSCPKPTLVADFDATAFAGDWYEVLKENSYMYEYGQDCSTQTYKLKSDGSLEAHFRARQLWKYGDNQGTLFCD